MAVRIEIRQSGASQIIRTKNANINDLLCGIVHRADEHLLFEAVEESYLNSDLTMYISEWRQINLEEFFFFSPTPANAYHACLAQLAQNSNP